MSYTLSFARNPSFCIEWDVFAKPKGSPDSAYKFIGNIEQLYEKEYKYYASWFTEKEVGNLPKALWNKQGPFKTLKETQDHLRNLAC